MFSLWINGNQRDEIDEGWIARTMQGLRRDGEAVYVRVSIKTEDVNLTLTAGRCDSGRGGGGRQPNAREHELLDRWAGCSLVDDFPPGQLTQCLKGVQRAA